MPRHSKSRSRKSKSRSRKSRLRGVVVPPGTNTHTAMRWVYKGKYKKTRGGVTKSGITRKYLGKDKDGRRRYRYISKKKQRQGKRLQRQYPYRSNEAFLYNIGNLPNM